MEIGRYYIVLAIILTASRISAGEGNCVVCDSSDCLTNPPTTGYCQAKECFTLVKSNGNVQRGCVSESAEKCDNDKICRKCTTSGDTPCNNQKEEKELFFCKTCDSTSDPNCASVKTIDSIVNNLCTAGVTSCLTQIKEKHTYRGCASEACPSGQKCTSCSSRGCNKDLYPSDRRKCYQCQSGSTNCANPTADTSLSYACQLYEEQDACYEFGTSDSTMARGCKSDSTNYGKCSSEKDKCKECTSDSCNSHRFKSKSTTKCVQCKAEETKCSGAFKPEDATECTTEIEYWEKEGCYTNRTESGQVVRGCAKDFDCAAAGASCSFCSGTACNTAEKLELSCYKCRSDENEKCKNEFTTNEYSSEKCRNAIKSEADRKCYIERWNGIVIRSCLVDADAKTQANCLNKDYKACETFDGDNSNKGKPPNSAYSIALTSGLLAMSMLLLKLV